MWSLDACVRHIEEHGIPLGIWKKFHDKEPLEWGFEETLGRDCNVPIPWDMYENHPLFREQKVYAFNDPSDPRRIIFMDFEHGMMAGGVTAYIGAAPAKGFHRIEDYHGTHHPLSIPPSLVEAAGLKPVDRVIVEGFLPDKDTPAYIVVSPVG